MFLLRTVCKSDWLSCLKNDKEMVGDGHDPKQWPSQGLMERYLGWIFHGASGLVTTLSAQGGRSGTVATQSERAGRAAAASIKAKASGGVAGQKVLLLLPTPV